MVDVGRGCLAADVFGPLEAPPVLMIAGGGADAASWVRLVPETAHDEADRISSAPLRRSLAADHRVAAFDQAGTGRSAEVDPADSAAQYADDALAVGAALLGERFFVVGMSLGGMAAQHVALRSPASVSGLILVSTIAAASSFVASVPTEDVPVERRSFADHFPESHPELFVHLAVRAERTRYHSAAELAQVAIFLSHEVADALDSIRCPTTVVCGREDRTFPVENSQQLAASIPGARLIELDRVGHAVHFEAPDSIADAVGYVVTQH